MLFNSINFLIFLPIVFFLYWFVVKNNLKLQNVLLLVSSYFFYACWDWRFLFLLVFSTLLDYYTGIKIDEAANKKKRLFWLWLSISVNLGFLGVFKYYNFFAASFASGLSLLGLEANLGSLSIILPVGISFYTFHGLSYVIDIYKNRIKPERSFIDYSVFVSFFPLLVAGPIERATHLLPQIIKKREFSYSVAVDGLRQILWGLFKKIVIADNAAQIANDIFNNSPLYSGGILVIGAILFAFQIYCDFSGYSDIALGTARLFGINLLRNFAFPYFSRDIAEFWRRWHISLSSWFKDYLYIPLGGSKGGRWIVIRNTFIIFIVSGFWHGANWTFIAWGLINALYFLPLLLLGKNRVHTNIVSENKYLPSLKEFFQITITFSLTVFAWIFFRARNINHAFTYIQDMFMGLMQKASYIELIAYVNSKIPLTLLYVFSAFIVVEWLGRKGEYAIEHINKAFTKPIRYVFYYAIVIVILMLGGEEQEFIYFQF